LPTSGGHSRSIGYGLWSGSSTDGQGTEQAGDGLLHTPDPELDEPALVGHTYSRHPRGGVDRIQLTTPDRHGSRSPSPWWTGREWRSCRSAPSQCSWPGHPSVGNGLRAWIRACHDRVALESRSVSTRSPRNPGLALDDRARAGACQAMRSRADRAVMPLLTEALNLVVRPLFTPKPTLSEIGEGCFVLAIGGASGRIPRRQAPGW